MRKRNMYFLICFLLFRLSHLFCSGSNVPKSKTTQREVTNPVTTVPFINFPISSTSAPFTTTTSSSPIPNAPTTTNPSVPSSTSASWCVASQSASAFSLQVALDYACGLGATDCSQIQPNGWCYEPNTIRDHANYAFNNFYLKNTSPSSCDFQGAAFITNTDPSYGKCLYPSISTSSSILNTTNESGSTVFGVQPSNPFSSAPTLKKGRHCFAFSTCLMLWEIWTFILMS